MLLKIKNLPHDIRYSEVKQMIKDQCGLTELILDNLVNDDDQGMRVTVGLADENDAALLISKVNGLFVNGCQVFVEDVRQKKQTNMPDPQMNSNQDMHSQNNMSIPPHMMQMAMPYNSLPFYMSSQNSYVNYSNQTSTPNPQAPFYQQDFSGFNYQQAGVPNPNQWQQSIDLPEQNLAPGNIPKKRDHVSPNRDKKKDSENNWRNPKPGPSRNIDRSREYRDYDRNDRSNSRFDRPGRSRHDQHYRAQERNIKSDIESKLSNIRKEYDNQYHRSELERSPPFSNRSNYERAMRERADHKKGNKPDRRKPRDFNDNSHRNDNFNQNKQAYSSSKRPFPNPSENAPRTFSNEPYNSTFTKRNFTGADNNPRGPPAKMARFNTGGNTTRNNEPVSYGTSIKKQNQCRHIASTQLAFNITATVNPAKTDNYFSIQKNLRKCIVARLDVILGDKIVTSVDEIINIYRSKFSTNDDVNFYNSVVEKLERDNQESISLRQEQANVFHPTPSFKKKQKTANQPMNTAPQPLNTAPQPTINTAPLSPVEKIPRYPNANKQEFKNRKKQARVQFQEQRFNSMDAGIQAALNEEINELSKIFVDTVSRPSDDDFEEKVRQIIVEDSIQGFAKVMRVQISRRILNLKTHLYLRIFVSPRLPKRHVVEKLLKGYGIETLRKSENKFMFLASCDSFESYDNLLAMGCLATDDITLHFKALHLAGPADKTTKRYKQRYDKITKTYNFVLQEEKKKKGKKTIDTDAMDEEEVFAMFQDNKNEDAEGMLGDDMVGDDMVGDDLDMFEDVDFSLDDTQIIPGDALNDSDVVVVETKSDVVIIDDQQTDTVCKNEDAKEDKAENYDSTEKDSKLCIQDTKNDVIEGDSYACVKDEGNTKTDDDFTAADGETNDQNNEKNDQNNEKNDQNNEKNDKEGETEADIEVAETTVANDSNEINHDKLTDDNSTSAMDNETNDQKNERKDEINEINDGNNDTNYANSDNIMEPGDATDIADEDLEDF